MSGSARRQQGRFRVNVPGCDGHRGWFCHALVLALAMPAVAAHADTIVFQDAFNRPAGATLGGAWVEQNELTGTACCHGGIRIDPGYIELAGNAMVFHYTKLPDSATPNANALPYTYAPLSVPTGAATLSFTLVAGADRMGHLAGLMDSTGGFVGPAGGEPYGRFL